MFGENLKRLRESKNMSRNEFAEDFGITLTTLKSYESGGRIPRISILMDLAKYFRVTVDELLSEKKEISRRRFVPEGKYKYEELPLVELTTGGHYTLTQISEIKDTEMGSCIIRGIAVHEVPANVVPEPDFFVYRVAYQVPSGLIVKFIHEDEMAEIVDKDIKRFLSGDTNAIFREHFEKEDQHGLGRIDSCKTGKRS